MRFLFFAIFLVSVLNSSFAQKDSVAKEKWRLDSNYVVSYPERLVLGIYFSVRSYELRMAQTLVPDSNAISPMKYIAQGQISSGISFAYDKIAFSLGSSSEITELDAIRKGITRTRNLSFSLNSGRYRLEAAYRKYTGFFDDNTPRRDSTFNFSQSPYFQLPNLYSSTLLIKGMYFFNKKKRFSYGAAFNNTARQLKTAGSFYLSPTFYKNLLSCDTSIIAPGTDSYYPNWEQFHFLSSYGGTINLGYSFNLVLLRVFFINFTGSAGFQLQHRTYKRYDQPSISEWKFGTAISDYRVSGGFNSKRFYVMFSYVGDFTFYQFKGLSLDARLNYGALNIGYRFKMRETKAIQWLKNNKFYQMI